MGSTMVEKILARTSGHALVRAGENIQAKPDFVVAYDFPGYTDVIFQQMKNDFGIAKVLGDGALALVVFFGLFSFFWVALRLVATVAELRSRRRRG